MTLELYLAHPFDERFNIREWELEFEKRTGIVLVNPFYDIAGIDVEEIDSGRAERYEKLDPNKLVQRDLKNVKEHNGVLGFVTGALSYGTIMEMFYAKQIHKPLYSIITNGHENHPWLKYCSDKIFLNNEDFENWISIDCKYCDDKMVVVGRNEKQQFDMYECNKCHKSWMEVQNE